MKTLRRALLAASAAAVLLPLPPVAAQAVGAGPASAATRVNVPAGDRLLGMTLTTNEAGDEGDALFTALSAGVQTTSHSIPWDAIEVAPWTYDPTQELDLILLDALYSSLGVGLVLGLNPIDTNHLRVPADLAGLPLDHPLVISRYDDLLAHVLDLVPNAPLVTLVIGNEVDVWLGDDLGRWAEYAAFFEATSNFARQYRPGTSVVAKMTFEGLVGPGAPLAASLIVNSDAVAATYYPLNPDFTVRSPLDVPADLHLLADTWPDHPILLLECGYPSGALTGSSEFLQALFVHEVFIAWDSLRDRMPLVEFFLLNDFSPDWIPIFLDYYGFYDPVFADFLGSLGLRTWPGYGQDKLAFWVFANEAAARGW